MPGDLAALDAHCLGAQLESSPLPQTPRESGRGRLETLSLLSGATKQEGALRGALPQKLAQTGDGALAPAQAVPSPDADALCVGVYVQGGGGAPLAVTSESQMRP